MTVRRVIFALAFCLIARPLAPRARAASPAATEYELKAVFIYKFAQFVTWPDSAFAGKSDPLIIATVGDDPFHGALERVMSGKAIGGRPLLVKHFANLDEIGRCHILFVCPSEADRLPDIFGKLSNRPILTIGDLDDFCQAGGIIQFYLDDERIRFEINPGAADRRGVRISSRLLQLAKIYKP